MGLRLFRNLEFLKCTLHALQSQRHCYGPFRQMNTNGPAISFLKESENPFVLPLLIIRHIAGDAPLAGLTVCEHDAGSQQAITDSDHPVRNGREDYPLRP